MRIRFTSTPKLPRDLAHLGYAAGVEVDLSDDQAARWLRRGVAEVVPAVSVPEPVEVVATESPVEVTAVEMPDPPKIVRNQPTSVQRPAAPRLPRS